MALTREEIAARYGTALFDYVQDMNALDSVYLDLQELHQALVANPRILKAFSDPVFNNAEKQKSLSIIDKGLSKEVQNFLNLLLSYNHFLELVEIIDYFNQLYDAEKKIMVGTAVTAVKLDDAQLQAIGESYAQKYHLAAVHLNNEVDKSVIGGVILKVGDCVIDGSVKNKLKKIRAQLISKN